MRLEILLLLTGCAKEPSLEQSCYTAGMDFVSYTQRGTPIWHERYTYCNGKSTRTKEERVMKIQDLDIEYTRTTEQFTYDEAMDTNGEWITGPNRGLAETWDINTLRRINYNSKEWEYFIVESIAGNDYLILRARKQK